MATSLKWIVLLRPTKVHSIITVKKLNYHTLIVGMAAAEPEGAHHSDSGEDVNIPDFVLDSSSVIPWESSADFLTGSPLLQDKPPRALLSLQQQDNQADSNVLISQELVATTLFTGEENSVSIGETMIGSPLYDVGLNQLLCEMPKHHPISDNHQEGSDATQKSPEPSYMQVEEDVSTDFPLENANLALSASTSENNDVSLSEKDEFLPAMEKTEFKQHLSSSIATLLPNEQLLSLSGDFLVHIYNENEPLYLIARLHYGSRAIQVLKVIPARFVAEQPESHYPTIFLSRHRYSIRSSKPKKLVSSSSNPLSVVPYTLSPLRIKTVSSQNDEAKVLSTSSEKVDFQAEETAPPAVNSSIPSAGTETA